MTTYRKGPQRTQRRITKGSV